MSRKWHLITHLSFCALCRFTNNLHYEVSFSLQNAPTNQVLECYIKIIGSPGLHVATLDINNWLHSLFESKSK